MSEDGIDPITATIVRLAVDGLWLSRVVGTDVVSSPLRDAVLECLTEMTRKKKG